MEKVGKKLQTHGDSSGRDKPKSKSARDLLIEFIGETRISFKEIGTRFDSLEGRVGRLEIAVVEHGKTINRLDKKLARVIMLNNLKS